MEKNSRDILSLSQIKTKHMDTLYNYRQELVKKPILKMLFFELTDCCNLSCLHCGSSSSPDKSKFLAFDLIKKVIDEVANKYNAKEIMICLTGGEPLLHPEFFRIADYIVSKKFSYGITTNATLIDDNMAQKLYNSKLKSISISLDGLEDKHDYFRNKIGAFNKTVAGIHNLYKYFGKSIPIQITTVIHKNNITQLDNMAEYFLSLPITSWRLTNIDPIGRAIKNNTLMLDKDDYIKLFDYIYKKRISTKNIEIVYGCAHYLTLLYERELREYYFICGSGIYVASILCNGDIFSCLDIERRSDLIQGNVKNDSFIDIWENKFQVFRRDRTNDCEMCSNCSDKKYCMADSTHTWDFENNAPKICFKNNIF
ncbi:MAG: radical SAM protein [Clostridia bacterium]